MTFVDPPPPAIGEVVFKFTNNGPDGPRPVPLGFKLIGVGLWAAGGFVLGLIAFFVVGGIMQHHHHEVRAEWFLYSLGIGGLVGALAGGLFALRPPKVSTLYVGKKGCVEITGGIPRLLEFANVQSMRPNISVVTFRGIRTEAREVYVTQGGRERLYLVSAARKQGDDAQYDYVDAVLAAFAARKQS
jgi:hypothetical protein